MNLHDPIRPLTPAQERVARLCARGWTYRMIGAALGIGAETVRHHVNDIAVLLPEDGITVFRRVQRWAMHAYGEDQEAG